eukprot:g5820.t1
MGICGSRGSIDRKVEMLKRTPFFLHMDEQQMRFFARFFKVLSLKAASKGGKAHYVFIQGEPANLFYAIGRGQVKLVAKKDTADEEVFLCAKRTGDFFGETALTQKEGVRTASAIIQEDCDLLSIDRKEFDRYLASAGSELAELVTSLMGMGMSNTLKEIPFLQGLPENVLNMVANLFSYQTFEAGQIVFSEGDEALSLYVVSHGMVECFAKDNSGQDKKFQDVRAGGYFGEIALMIGIPRTATVRATEKSLLLALGRSDFENLLTLSEDLRANLQEAVRHRVARTLTKFDVPFFRSIPTERYPELAAITNIEKMTAGETIFKHGDKGAEFYLIMYGSVVIKNQEGKVFRKMTDGSYFGEIALVANKERTATVEVESKSIVLLSITKENFMKFFEANPQAYAEFAIRLTQDEVPLGPVLLHPEGLALFRKFVEAEYSAENLRFHEAVLKYTALTDEAEMQTMAKDLLDRFIRDDGQETVNILARIREKTIKTFESGPARRDLFNRASEEVMKLMDQDSFKRFKHTEDFQALLKAVGAYSDQQSNDINRDAKSKLLQAASIPIATSLSHTDKGSGPPADSNPPIVEEQEQEQQGKGRTPLLGGSKSHRDSTEPVDTCTLPKRNLWASGPSKGAALMISFRRYLFLDSDYDDSVTSHTVWLWREPRLPCNMHRGTRKIFEAYG